jgi:putative transposase
MSPINQHEEWQPERRHFFSEATIAKFPDREEVPELTDADWSAQPDEPIS